jgi:hypothetical protein
MLKRKRTGPYRLQLPPTRRECDDRTVVLRERLAEIRAQLAAEPQIGPGLRYQDDAGYGEWRRRATMALMETERDLSRIKAHRATLPVDVARSSPQFEPVVIIDGLLSIIDAAVDAPDGLDDAERLVVEAARRFVGQPDVAAGGG